MRHFCGHQPLSLLHIHEGKQKTRLPVTTNARPTHHACSSGGKTRHGPSASHVPGTRDGRAGFLLRLAGSGVVHAAHPPVLSEPVANPYPPTMENTGEQRKTNESSKYLTCALIQQERNDRSGQDRYLSSGERSSPVRGYKQDRHA